MGDARIGLAVSDPTGIVCSPIAALTRTGEGDDIAAVLRVAEREGAGRIVVGLPLSLDGSHGPRARLTLRFTSALRAAAEIPVDSWDERFSTAEAERRLRDAGVQPSRDRARLDSAAAAIILEAYLVARPRGA